jgi:hypothetical protein
MRPVIIESPYGTNPDGSRADAETVAKNVRYLHACMLHAMSLGEAPFASHGLYPGPLNDAKPEERKMGIEAGFAIGRVLAAAGAARAFYVDEGMTPGMRLAVPEAEKIGQPIEYRTLPGWRR